MIQLNGSHGEGGGSIARVALALSTLLRKPFSISAIRQNRPQPGLKNQHLYCIKALQKLCNAQAVGADLGSLNLSYIPGIFKGKKIEVDIETAGSIPLFCQAVILPALFADKTTTLTVTGGTDGKWASSFDYFKEVFLPTLSRFADVECRLLRRGYYPKGQGKAELKIKPHLHFADSLLSEIQGSIKPYLLGSKGTIVHIKGISHASAELEQAHVAERQAKSAKLVLAAANCPVSIHCEYQRTESIGSGITLWAAFENPSRRSEMITIGSDTLGEKGKRAEVVGMEAAQELMGYIKSDAAIDVHLADQILPYMALLPESAIRTSKITDHMRSNIYTITHFLNATYTINENDCIITVP